MLFKKLLRTFGKYKAQFISMIVMILLGVGIFAGFNAEWYSIDADTSSFYEATSIADYHIYNTSGTFTAEDVEKIKAINGVSAATRFMEVSATESKENDTVKIIVSENFTVSTFQLLSGDEYDEKSENGIWLSSNYSKRNDYKKGDEITISYGSVKRTFTIMGIMMSGDYLINTDGGALMPDYDAVGYAYISPKAYESMSTEMLGFTYYYAINARSSLSEADMSEAVDKAMGRTMQILAKENYESYSEAAGEADEGKAMGLLIPVIFLLIAVLTMVTTMNRLMANEKTQIGILKALGFKNRRIIWHYTSYALFISLVGSVIGMALGYVVAVFIFSESGSMGTYFEMPDWTIHMPWFAWAGTLAIILFMTFVGYLSVRKVLKGSAADALRPYTPKKMKNLLIEKTKLFHKLNFASRWNLRDTFRHPARTFMTIFGVFGCTLLLFASFGMKSTMDDYINVNYDILMNYETKLVLSDDITNEKAKELVEEYDGDYSSDLAVKVNGTTYVATVFNNDHDMYRMVVNRKQVKDVSDEGVYICQRMAEDLKLKKGSTFSFTVYGASVSHEAVVVGIVNSNTEGFQMTDAYAEKLGLTYTISGIYTNVEKSNIVTDKYVTSSLSKADIIKTFDTFMDIMNEMVWLLVAFSGVLAFVVLYNLGSMSYVERYRELATLRVLGFKNKKLGNLLISQNMSLTVIGILIGCPVGYVVLVWLYKLLAGEYELTVFCNWYVYVISIVATLAVSFVVSWFVSRKVKKIDMVESLKAE